MVGAALLCSLRLWLTQSLNLKQRAFLVWGAQGCQPVCLGSLPRRVFCDSSPRENVAGRLPATQAGSLRSPESFAAAPNLRSICGMFLTHLECTACGMRHE